MSQYQLLISFYALMAEIIGMRKMDSDASRRELKEKERTACFCIYDNECLGYILKVSLLHGIILLY